MENNQPENYLPDEHDQNDIDPSEQLRREQFSKFKNLLNLIN